MNTNEWKEDLFLFAVSIVMIANAIFNNLPALNKGIVA